jgi:hypothetical protein
LFNLSGLPFLTSKIWITDRCKRLTPIIIATWRLK